MAEPEDVLAEGALHATRLARDLWARHAAGRAPGSPELRDLRRRLELFVAAVFPAALEIGTADPPAPVSLLARLARRGTAHLHPARALATTTGGRIRLPARLDAVPGDRVADRYRLLALEQAARGQRGTPAMAPDDALLGDLYRLSEAAAVDALLARMFPRLASQLVEARREAVTTRPTLRRASARELAVERLVLDLLQADPDRPPEPLTLATTASDSLAWARDRRRLLAQLPGPYRGVAPVALWGARPAPEPTGSADPLEVLDQTGPAPGRSRTLPRQPRVREATPDEDDPEPGTWMVRADDLQEKAEDPAGLMRPADRDRDADPGELADALSELPEARLVRTPEPVAEVLAGEEPVPRARGLGSGAEGRGVAYPEWDWRAGAYHTGRAIVHQRVAGSGSEGWVEQTMRRHAALIRTVRRDFERLRPRRTALPRQTDGAELDLDALIAGYADRRRRGVSDERWYVDARPARRDAAIALLVDTSASTDGWVTGDRRIIDVEKEALVIVGEALAALGDPHAVFAFASAGPARVTVQILKSFDEAGGTPAVRRRIAGLEPDGFTRVGAAIRHATAALARRAARYRLLILLSDGRPNDVDQYEGRYGVEDARMAVIEARLQGLHLHCLTVDRQAPRYAPHIFGRNLAVLPRAEGLSRALTSLLRDLVRG